MSGLEAALEAGLSDIGELRSLLDDEGLIGTRTVEDDLEWLDVDFPLDDAEAKILLSFYAGHYEYAGRLIVKYTNEGQWTTLYVED